MRLSDMLLREDFYKILADTVTEYFHLVHNREVAFSYKKTDGSEKLIVNGMLGFISRFPAPSGLRKFMLAEFNVRGSKLKFLVGKAAALIMSTFPQVGKQQNAYLVGGTLGKNTFISPQNRSIRFFDYDAMTVDCIIKSGFTSKYFVNQLAFRKQYRYDFVLPLLEHGDRWFREIILTGHPLARVTNETQYQKSMQETIICIGQLAADTIAYEESSGYAQGLLTRITELLEEAEHRKHIAYGKQTMQMAQTAMDRIKSHPMPIPTCIGHGDLQSGNIWVDEAGKTWIYDWETAGRRSVWYDSAVLMYSLRRAYGWQDFLSEELPKDIYSCDPQKVRTQDEITVIKAIILMEDILFYLEDMLELPQNWGAQIYDGFANRMWQLLKDF
ncbi:MAG: phosphotransferase [Oscillospiraceae bacterium]|nr:phosphotransferase [Oscillospiraceae bacterium]